MNETEVICRLCLEIIKKPLPIDKMTEEIIGLLMLKLDLRITPEPVMCYGCAETLQKAFNFKTSCIYTEDCLYPFIEGKSEAGLDLRDIYLKVNDKENVESVKEREVCRFCMKSNDSGLYTPVDVIEENVEIKKLLENYLPEVVMGVIEKPVACENCLTFLRHYSLFVTRFSNVEQQIQAYAKKTLERDYVGAIDLRQVKGFSLSNVTKCEVGNVGIDKVAKEEVMIFSEIENEKKIIPEEKIKCEEKEINESKISMVSPETERREQEEFDSFARSNELFRSNQIPDVEKAQADIEMKRSFLEPIETEVKRTCHEEDVSHIEKVKGEAEKCQRSLSSHKIDDCQELKACLGIKLMEFEIKKEDNEYDGNKNNTLILIGPGMIYSKDAEMKPTVVYMSYNPEANHTGIETGPDQDTSEMEAGNPEGHQVESAEGVEGRIYRCKLCPYKNKTKYGFTRHMLVHKDISEVTAHRCELCPYMAKRKYDLTVHMLIHKDPSETPTYDCNVCSFKAIRKYTLKDHMLIHKNAYTREATVHQCALCPYKTKGKSNMTSHMQTHVTYDCDKCSFKTKLKRHLTRHMLIHKNDSKNPSEMETEDPNGLQVKPVGDLEKTHYYRCKLCPYKSKLRKCWTKHMLNHEDISENASETETGNPKSVRVESVEDVEGTIYRCKLCPYKTQIKRYLTTHMFVHKDISEVKAHRCTLCPYKAKRKCGLTKHMLTHKDISEVTTYDCNLCSYKAKRKQSLSHHMMIHIDSSKDAKSAQTRQGSMSEHQELEGCSIIKSEEVDIKDEEDE